MCSSEARITFDRWVLLGLWHNRVVVLLGWNGGDGLSSDWSALRLDHGGDRLNRCGLNAWDGVHWVRHVAGGHSLRSWLADQSELVVSGRCLRWCLNRNDWRNYRRNNWCDDIVGVVQYVNRIWNRVCFAVRVLIVDHVLEVLLQCQRGLNDWQFLAR